MDAAATINFKSAEVRRLFEGSYYLRPAFVMYIPVNCQNSGRGPGSCSVGMLRGIVKNLQLKRYIKRSLLLCSSHLSHHVFARGH